MEIAVTVIGSIAELAVRGRLDSYWADHLDARLTEIVRAGHDRVRIDLADVAFLSSAGIAVLVKFYKRLRELGGTLVVARPSAPVRTVLRITRLAALLVEPDTPGGETPTAGDAPRRVQANGIELDVFDISPDARLAISRRGSAGFLTTPAAALRCERLSCSSSLVAVGIGALGADPAECRGRYGEFLAVAGAAVYLPGDGTGVPDYLIASETFAPEMRVLCSLGAEGTFARLARFETAPGSAPVTLAQLAAACLELAGSAAAAVAIVAEADSLVGAALRSSPTDRPASEGLFDFPAVRDRLAFTVERAFARSVSLVAGVVARDAWPDLRPLSTQSNLYGHFHAAAFPSGPLRRGRLDLRETTGRLFEHSSPQGVLHLLTDDRGIAGVGQSEFVRGACWVGPLDANGSAA
jgi:anti-anti-sigma factor